MVIDSLSNCQLENDGKKFDDGKAAHGFGGLQRMMKQLVNNINTRIGDKNMACLFTSHMYEAGADMMGNKIYKPNVGEATLFIPSTVIELKKRPLKDGKDITGISVSAKTMKSRFTKLSESTSFSLPWDTGMDYYDGSIEVLEEAGTITKNGGWYSYTNRETGELVKFQRSTYTDHADLLFGYYADDFGEISEKPEDEANVEMLEGSEE